MTDPLPPEPVPQDGSHAVLREIGTVFRHEFRHLAFSLRTLIPMFVFLGCGGLALLFYVWAAGKVREAAEQQLGEGAVTQIEASSTEMVGKALELFGYGNQGDAAEMMRDHVPLLVVFLFAASSFFLPLLVALVSFDQFSELSTRGARFALLRVRRETYFAGKALAGAASIPLFLLLMWLLVGIVAASRGTAEDVPHALREALRAWALSCVVALPYLSLTAVVSATTRPGLAFLGTFGLWIALWIGDGVLGLLSNRPDATGTIAGVLVNVFPSNHSVKLVSRHLPTVGEGILGLVLIAAAGYGLAAWIIRRRDV